MIGFACRFCQSTKTPRAEKHFTQFGGWLALGLPLAAFLVFVQLKRLEANTPANTLVLFVLILSGLAFAILGRKPRHFCQDCKASLE